MDVSIVVAPRERFSSTPASLRSLFATIPPEVPVVVVDGGFPKDVLQEIDALAPQRPFRHVSLPYLITPQEARNIGIRETASKYIVLSDNDIDYTEGWLERLVGNAEEHGSDAVAPLIFIGPPDFKIIHHAGGRLTLKLRDGNPVVNEAHRLMDADYEAIEPNLPRLAPVENEICEFHCMLLTRDFWERMGGLDERMITREQMDFALRARAMGAKVTFEKDSRVQYRAKADFDRRDLTYHLYRWSDPLAVDSLDAFEETWNLKLDRNVVRYGWVRMHRRRAIKSAYPKFFRIVRHKRLQDAFCKILESRVLRRLEAERSAKAARNVPVTPPTTDLVTLFGTERVGEAA